MAVLELTTVEDVMRYPGMSSIGKNDKDWVLQLIRGFSARAEKYCNREFYQESRTRYYNGDGYARIIQLPAFGNAANSVTSINEDSARTFTDTALGSDSYFFDTETGMLSHDSRGWLAGRGVIKVVWSGGLGTSVESVPDDIRGAATQQCVYSWQRRNEIGLEERRYQRGAEITISGSGRLLPDVQDVLDGYKIHLPLGNVGFIIGG